MDGWQILKALLAFGIAAVLAWVLILIAVGEPSVPPLEQSGYDQQLNDLDRQAVEVAYINQVAHLFGTWMKDPTDQPRRALIGLRKARRAFIDANTEIDRRK